MTKNKSVETLVIGHRNPDTDSVAASYAMAELKKMLGMKNVRSACAGLPGARTEYLFKRFKVPLPQVRSDIYPRVRNILNSELPELEPGDSLLNGLEQLERFHVPRLPVVDKNRKFCGMLCLFSLLGDLLQTAEAKSGIGLTGRRVRSSLSLITRVLDGDALSIHRADVVQDFEVYVAAMNIESFKEHIPRSNPQSLAIIVGDRTDIHLMALNLNVRLMIVTGSRKVDKLVLQAARDRGLSIIKTPFDSATVVRRLKFSCPIETLLQKNIAAFRLDDRLSEIHNRVMNDHDDVFPVADQEGRLLGTFNKNDLENVDSCRLILVDHNEFDQAIEGIEEVRIVEVVDHHRLGMPPTHTPIRITCDVVGSTCTLITEMFIQFGLELPPAVAGILMGGVITDTLLLRSPTTTGRDKMAVGFLKSISGVEPEALMQEIFTVGSVIARSTPLEVLTADCKNFRHLDRFSFSISQVEEVSFDEFHAQKNRLLEAAKSFAEREKLDFFGLLVTNVVRENSLLLAIGRKDILEALPYRKISEHLYDLPGVLSRKKQLLPQILKTLDTL